MEFPRGLVTPHLKLPVCLITFQRHFLLQAESAAFSASVAVFFIFPKTAL